MKTVHGQALLKLLAPLVADTKGGEAARQAALTEFPGFLDAASMFNEEGLLNVVLQRLRVRRAEEAAAAAAAAAQRMKRKQAAAAVQRARQALAAEAATAEAPVEGVEGVEGVLTIILFRR